MPAEYRIDRKAGCVYSFGTDTFTDEQILHHQKTLAADPEFTSDLDQLWDFRALTRIELSTETVQDLARNNPFGAGSRRAFCAVSDLAFGLSRMFQSYAGGSEDQIEVFRSYDEALRWLGLTERSS